eukprot:jgi/Bigna1/134362/aug1.24_g9070
MNQQRYEEEDEEEKEGKGEILAPIQSTFSESFRDTILNDKADSSRDHQILKHRESLSPNAPRYKSSQLSSIHSGKRKVLQHSPSSTKLNYLEMLSGFSSPDQSSASTLRYISPLSKCPPTSVRKGKSTSSKVGDEVSDSTLQQVLLLPSMTITESECPSSGSSLEHPSFRTKTMSKFNNTTISSKLVEIESLRFTSVIDR